MTADELAREMVETPTLTLAELERQYGAVLPGYPSFWTPEPGDARADDCAKNPMPEPARVR